LSAQKEFIKLCEIDTRIIEINEKDALESNNNNNNHNNDDSEIESTEELVFKGRNSKYPKRVKLIFILKKIICWFDIFICLFV